MEDDGSEPTDVAAAPPTRKKKPKKRNKEGKSSDNEVAAVRTKKPRLKSGSTRGYSAAQAAVNEQMRRALEEDQYSAAGSIVDTESDEEEVVLYKGQPIRLDRAAILQAAKKRNKPEAATTDEKSSKGAAGTAAPTKEDVARKLKSAPPGKKKETKTVTIVEDELKKKDCSASPLDPLGLDLEDDPDRDGGSIFGQTTGSSNSTWVECDKCKKWRRLRGVVDEKKLPKIWVCSLNKNDPERNRCSAPEEEYETSHTPESAADARTRKHLRVWVRRLQCNEAYEARQPTLTRGKKRAAASSSKEPYEWIRCCNPSCGKWRALLRIMDAKANVIDRTTDGEWYCVMNTWDEKVASCAAPQENLPAIGCPPWVMQDDD